MKTLLNYLLDGVKKGLKTSFYMIKFMVPVSIVVKILQETGLMEYVGIALAPLMKLVGLPGEMGFVWATSMLSNIYGGLIAYFQLSDSVNLNGAQVTILATMILIAHTFPIELVVTQRSGMKIWFGLTLRFSMALLAGVLLNLYYSWVGSPELLQLTDSIFVVPESPSWGMWLLAELKNYALIMIWITALIFVIDILERLKVIYYVNKALKPLLRPLGIGEKVMPLMIVGMTLGLAYGGGLIISKVKDEKLNPRDVFYAVFLMSLCHSIIEDTLLMVSIGGHYSGIIIFRLIFTFVITFIFVRLTRFMSEKTMRKVFYSKYV